MTNKVILEVWSKAIVVPPNDPLTWRKDPCGAWIKFVDYGNRKSDYGWEVDHIQPDSNDIPTNLRPLHWINNVEKSDGRLTCPVIAQNTRNVRRRT